jgi:hypothetical protein
VREEIQGEFSAIGSDRSPGILVHVYKKVALVLVRRLALSLGSPRAERQQMGGECEPDSTASMVQMKATLYDESLIGLWL